MPPRFQGKRNAFCGIGGEKRGGQAVATELREVTEVLGKLADLRASGALTDREFGEQE
jgi:hypothetical protein